MAEDQKLGIESAFPITPPVDPTGLGSAGGYPYPEAGLTKRELFAAMAMAGSLGGVPGNHLVPENLARFSVEQADALLKELAK
jgi:hypothetical protein